MGTSVFPIPVAVQDSSATSYSLTATSANTLYEANQTLIAGTYTAARGGHGTPGVLYVLRF